LYEVIAELSRLVHISHHWFKDLFLECLEAQKYSSKYRGKMRTDVQTKTMFENTVTSTWKDNQCWALASSMSDHMGHGVTGVSCAIKSSCYAIWMKSQVVREWAF
jgi:hypothetical protein